MDDSMNWNDFFFFFLFSFPSIKVHHICSHETQSSLMVLSYVNMNFPSICLSFLQSDAENKVKDKTDEKCIYFAFM